MSSKGSRKVALAKSAVCPKCGRVCLRDMNDIIKEWNATPWWKRKSHSMEIWIHYWRCPGCGHKFRTATRIWPKGPRD